MPEIWRRRGATSPGRAGVRACLCLLVVLQSWRPAAAADTSQSSRVDGREALKAAVALVQQGQLAEADRQAQRALADPETRAVANSVSRHHQAATEQARRQRQAARRGDPARATTRRGPAEPRAGLHAPEQTRPCARALPGGPRARSRQPVGQARDRPLGNREGELPAGPDADDAGALRPPAIPGRAVRRHGGDAEERQA